MRKPTSTAAKPCKRGHVAGRKPNGTCKECDRLSANARRAADPERYRKQRKKRHVAVDMLQGARARARRGGYPCTITVHDIVIPEFCPLLGIKLERGAGVGNKGAGSPSLDKIIPTLGYVPGNVWVISHRANALKGNATLQELQTLVERLARAISR
jgi:hypothetical protein